MRLKIFLSTILVIGLLSACNKDDDFNYPAGTVGSSRITYFPILTLKGASIVAIPTGGTYTELGVTAKEGTTDIPFTTSGTVNTATPGVYTLTYTAVNKDGFSASVKRTVAVYTTDAGAAAQDLSGTYLRAATGASAVWTKVAPGVYSVFNPGGAVGNGLIAVAFNPTGNTIFIPSQTTNDGNTTSSSNEVYSPGPPATYTWKINNPGFGTGLRTFVKQ
jgi:hypothetical protein